MLQRHLRMHVKNDENFYGCKVCALSFVCFEALQSHLRGENHRRMKVRIQGVFVCVECRRVFPSRDSYAMHMLLRAQTEACGDVLSDMGDGEVHSDTRGGDGLPDKEERATSDGNSSRGSVESALGCHRDGVSPGGTPTETVTSNDLETAQHPLNLSISSGGEEHGESVVAQAQSTAENGLTEKVRASPDYPSNTTSPQVKKNDEDRSTTELQPNDRSDGGDWTESQSENATTLASHLRNDAEPSMEFNPALSKSRWRKPRGISSSHYRTLAAASMKRTYGPWANRNRIVRRGSVSNTPMTCVLCWALMDSCDSLAMHMMEQHSQPKSYFSSPGVQPRSPQPRTIDDSAPSLLQAFTDYQTHASGIAGTQCSNRVHNSASEETTNSTASSQECGMVLPDSTRHKTSQSGLSDDSDLKRRRMSPVGESASALGKCRLEVVHGKASELCPQCGVGFCEHTAWELLTKNGTIRSPISHASFLNIPTTTNGGFDAAKVSRPQQATTCKNLADATDSQDKHTGDEVRCLVAPGRENEAMMAEGYRAATDETSNKTLSPQLPEPSHMRVSEDGSSGGSSPSAAPPSLQRSTPKYDDLGEGDVIDYVLSNVDRLAMCKYCRIVFTDRTIYYLHMGLHNLNNPWQCNLCGHVCSNVHEFSSHVIHY